MTRPAIAPRALPLRWLRPVALAIAALLPACGEPGPTVVVGTAADHGEALFADTSLSDSEQNPYACATCHSASGASTSETGALLPGGSLAGATERPHYWGGQELDLLAAVNQCLVHFLARKAPWTAEDEEAQALYAYLESISEGESGAPVPFTVVMTIEDLPGGDATRGEEAYEKACSQCHGPAHAKDERPLGAAPVLPEHALDAYPPMQRTAEETRLVYIEQVRRGAFGGHGGEMPPFSLEVLSDQDLADVLGYLDLQ